MKKLLIISAAVALVMSSCGGGGSVKSEQDSLAYALGMDIGNNVLGGLKSIDSTLNKNLVIAGFTAVLKEQKSAKMDKDSVAGFLQDYFMVRKPAREKAASEKFLQEVESSNPNVKKTASGLLYEIIVPGDTMKAKPENLVKVIYEGRLKDGTVFDASKNHGNDTAEFVLNRVITGWTEGMALVGKGGKIKLWIPSDLAYGSNPQGPGGGNQALEFDVELIDILPAPAQPEMPMMQMQ